VRIRIIDAFTDHPFAGNPAAVCLLSTYDWPDENWMRQVAAEMNLSETAFAHPLQSRDEADCALRWFTPLVEDDLCGHATLAMAHALYSDGIADGPIRFSTRSGVLVARPQDDGSITLDFPAMAPVERSIPDGLVEALGAQPEAVFNTGKLGDLLAVFGTEGAVRALAPTFGALANVTRRNSIRGVTATAQADAGNAYNFVSRFFSPADGIPEDPVTGSAHTALAPFWSARIGRSSLVGLQVSARTGLVLTELHDDRVYLTGRAVTVLDGTLLSAAEP
jgi:PhzF family phenazine biosynthesis protein